MKYEMSLSHQGAPDNLEYLENAQYTTHKMEGIYYEIENIFTTYNLYQNRFLFNTDFKVMQYFLATRWPQSSKVIGGAAAFLDSGQANLYSISSVLVRKLYHSDSVVRASLV
jgi:hypothetical protein